MEHSSKSCGGAERPNPPQRIELGGFQKILLGCGLRRAELTALRVEDIQQREEHWVIADLIGKGGHIRTIPVLDWVKAGIDAWMATSGIAGDILFGESTKLAEFGVAASVPRSSGAW